MQTPNSDHLQEKWAPLLDYEGLDPIKDPHRRAVTAALLENQEQAIREEREFLSEEPTNFTNSSGATAGFSAQRTWETKRLWCLAWEPGTEALKCLGALLSKASVTSTCTDVLAL